MILFNNFIHNSASLPRNSCYRHFQSASDDWPIIERRSKQKAFSYKNKEIARQLLPQVITPNNTDVLFRMGLRVSQGLIDSIVAVYCNTNPPVDCDLSNNYSTCSTACFLYLVLFILINMRKLSQHWLLWVKDDILSQVYFLRMYSHNSNLKTIKVPISSVFNSQALP